MLPLKDAFIELATTVINASLCYDVWWELQNVDNRVEYESVVNEYFAFFEANSTAQLVTMIVLMYQVYENRKDTQNFWVFLERLRKERSDAENIASELQATIEGLMPVWKKIARARSSVIAHLSNKAAASTLMEEADLSPDAIGDFIVESKSLLKRVAGYFGIMGWAVLDMQAVGHTRELMRALIKGRSGLA